MIIGFREWVFLFLNIFLIPLQSRPDSAYLLSLSCPALRSGPGVFWML